MRAHNPYTEHEIERMRRENDKVLSKVNVSKTLNAPEVSTEERRVVRKVTTRAFKKLQAMGFISK
jgi:hypothetical protein